LRLSFLVTATGKQQHEQKYKYPSHDVFVRNKSKNLSPYGGACEAAHLSFKVRLVTHNWRVVRFQEMGWVEKMNS
jgi:hypothetical protein